MRPTGRGVACRIGVFTKGRKITVKSGAFVGQTGVITGIFVEGRDRVHILLTLLGVDTELQMPSYAIEAA